MLVTYSSAPDAVTTVSSQSPVPNCGTNAVTCSRSYQASNPTCGALINAICFSGQQEAIGIAARDTGCREGGVLS